MKTISDIINELIDIKDNLGERAEEILYDNMNYNNEYRDLTKTEIQELNKYRKNIYYIYEAIHTLDKIKESD